MTTPQWIYDLITRRRIAILCGLIFLGLTILVGTAGESALVHLRQVSGVQWCTLAAMMLIVITLNLARLMLLVERTRYTSLTTSGIVRIYLAIELFAKISPAGSAAPVAAGALMRRHGMPFHKVVSIFFTTALADAIVLLCLLSLLVIGTAIGLAWPHPHFILSGLLAIMLLFFVTGLSFLLHGHQWVTASAKPAIWLGIPYRYRLKLARFVLRVRRSLAQSLTMPPVKLAAFLLCTLAYWLILLSTLYAALVVLGASPKWLHTLVIQFAAMLGGHMLMAPGGAAGTEVTALVLLSSQYNATMAATGILIWRVMIYYLYIFLGAIATLLEINSKPGPRKIRNRKGYSAQHSCRDDSAEKNQND